jgi:hypothetical protein
MSLAQFQQGLVFKLARTTYVDVCADVFGTGEYLVNGRSSPQTIILCPDTSFPLSPSAI